ncbi:FliH/SctL family protein [Actomonas aquatica]|uniref:Flagellar assembly protein FliH n=1 Tax=Actomonas aquatica TaxID=2866162 RepID=A0ABZ1CCX5_9BACT|nr:FliH/SctL family protein [Opitutus sp. WL0086]WRQ89281.1 FliH/SctL family protein [Opitutus sp. WL0086]
MPTSTLIRFDRPLRGARISGQLAPVSHEDMEKARTEAYQQGQDAARAFADQQMVEVRTELQALQDGIFRALGEIEPSLVQQVREALPELVLESTRRLLEGFEPDPDQVSRICQDTLEQLYPETNNLELRLSSRDADLLDKLSPDWLRRYPEMRITRDSHLRPGDCVVHSRFGVTDARLDAKLQNLGHELLGANG